MVLKVKASWLYELFDGDHPEDQTSLMGCHGGTQLIVFVCLNPVSPIAI
jgi:hypothetical protein